MASQRTLNRLARQSIDVQDLVHEAAANLAADLEAVLDQAKQIALRGIRRSEIEPAEQRFVFPSVRNSTIQGEVANQLEELFGRGFRVKTELDRQIRRAIRAGRDQARAALSAQDAAIDRSRPFRLSLDAEGARANVEATLQEFGVNIQFRFNAILNRTMTQADFIQRAIDEISRTKGARLAARNVASELRRVFNGAMHSEAARGRYGEGEGELVTDGLWMHRGPVDMNNVTDIVEVNPPGQVSEFFRGRGSRDFIKRVLARNEWEAVNIEWNGYGLHYNERGVFLPIDPASKEAKRHESDRAWLIRVLQGQEAQVA